jgi:DNA polymerase-3 subunit gamma/tau
MSEYQVLARRYRPQSFKEVLGQDAIVTTLKNAIKRNSLAHAYLFCGARGTGKTTLARVFAKALNCQNPTADQEPCNHCSSCKEITSGGNSLDVLEIDGASHRGIDDIRRINETVGYATASGKYKIYIIDEVHMLTKEAFNALLKTLEEPPPKVLFFFATTEPHKVLPTIMSRCQRFNLNRIPLQDIIGKLRLIAQELQVPVQEDALYLLATRADGGLRDAESLFDQILAFHEGEVTAESVAAILGMMPRDSFFELDRAGKEANLAVAFEIADRVFSQGKDVTHFVESLTEHFRNLLMLKLTGVKVSSLSVSSADREKYEASAKMYSQEQCLSILDFLIESQQQNRFSAMGRVGLETILLRILRTHQMVPIEFLVRRLAELEQSLGVAAPSEVTSTPMPAVVMPSNRSVMPTPKKEESSLSEDPTPTPADIGIKTKKSASKSELLPAPPPPPHFDVETTEPIAKPNTVPVELGARPTEEARIAAVKQQSRYDTLLQFATVELEGTIQKKQYNRF